MDEKNPFEQLCALLATMHREQQHGQWNWERHLPTVFALIDKITDPAEQSHIQTWMARWMQSINGELHALRAEQYLLEAQRPDGPPAAP
jgi:hypothetical protein